MHTAQHTDSNSVLVGLPVYFQGSNSNYPINIVHYTGLFQHRDIQKIMTYSTFYCSMKMYVILIGKYGTQYIQNLELRQM